MEDTSRPAIVVEDLRFHYPPRIAGGAETVALRGVSFSVCAGEAVSICGPLGSGKTTLCLALSGLIPHCTGGAIGGRVLVQGLDTRLHSPGEICRRVGVVLENSDAQILTDCVEDELAFGLESLGIPRRDMRTRIDRALEAVGLETERRASPRRLSGGQKQRLALAAALAMRPSVLVLDEPTANLDPAAARELTATLRRLSRVEGAAIIVAGEDIEWLAASTDRLLGIDGGSVVLSCRSEQIALHVDDFDRIGVALPAAVQLSRLIRTRLPEVPVCSTSAELLNALGRERQAEATSAAPDVNVGCGAPVLEASDVRFRYAGGREVLTGVNLAVCSGTATALVGRNGSGKTTLAKHLIGLLRPTSGTISAFGENVRDRAPGELARRIGFSFQNPDNQLFAASVRSELAFGPSMIGQTTTQATASVARTMDLFELGEFADVPPALLGFGLRKLVALASIAAMRPEVLVLDEPLAGLGWAQTRILRSALADMSAGADRTLILVTHDMAAVAELAGGVAVMIDGQIAAVDTPTRVFGQSDLIEAAGLERPLASDVAALLTRLGFAPASLRWSDLVEAAVASRGRGTDQNASRQD